MGTQDYSLDVDTTDLHEALLTGGKTKLKQGGITGLSQNTDCPSVLSVSEFLKDVHSFLPWRINMLSRKTFFNISFLFTSQPEYGKLCSSH